MPFGISPALEYVQQFLEREIENLPGVRTVADDIIIYGEGDIVEAATVDHDRKLKACFDRCRKRNIKINKDRNLTVRLKSHARIHFLHHIWRIPLLCLVPEVDLR
jgi:hypothetical protein